MSNGNLAIRHPLGEASWRSNVLSSGDVELRAEEKGSED